MGSTKDIYEYNLSKVNIAAKNLYWLPNNGMEATLSKCAHDTWEVW